MPIGKCECAYCREGTGEVDEQREVAKRLKKGLKGWDWKPMFRDRINKEDDNAGRTG